VKTAAQYIADAKAKLGDPRMSDRELGVRLGGFVQSYVAGAKRGKMTDPLAVKLEELLKVEKGEILLVARMEREKDPQVRARLEAFVFTVGKLLDRASKNAASAIAALAVALGLLLSPNPSEAGAGGVGR
jgi:hypothetical protein